MRWTSLPSTTDITDFPLSTVTDALPCTARRKNRPSMQWKYRLWDAPSSVFVHRTFQDPRLAVIQVMEALVMQTEIIPFWPFPTFTKTNHDGSVLQTSYDLHVPTQILTLSRSKFRRSEYGIWVLGLITGSHIIYFISCMTRNHKTIHPHELVSLKYRYVGPTRQTRQSCLQRLVYESTWDKLQQLGT